MFKKSTLLVIVLMVALTLSFTTLAAKKEIEYWSGWGGTELEDLKVIIEEFNEANPDFVVKTTTIFGAYEKLLTAIAGGEAPDVVSAVWDSQLAALAERGALLSLDEYVEASDKVKAEDFFPALWESFYYKDSIWALAATTNTHFTVYNKDMFAEAGLDPEKPPITTDELEEYTEKVTIKDNRGNFTRFGYIPGGLIKWNYVFGGSWYDEATGKITADHPKNVEALQWLADFVSKYDVNKVDQFSAGFGNYWSPANPFFAGKLAMQDYGEWIQQFGEKYGPDVKWAPFPYPYPEGGRKNVTDFAGSMFTIPKGSENPDEAWEFIEWVTGSYATKKIAIVFTNMPPRHAVAKDAELLEKVPILKFGLKLLEGPNAFGAVPIAVYEMLSNEVGQAEDAVKHGDAEAAAALAAVTEKIQKELDMVLGK